MTEFAAPSGPLPHIPDDVTVGQFIFSSNHDLQPHRPQNTPWLVEDGSGTGYGREHLENRTKLLANALSRRFNIRKDDVVLLFSPNHIDYAVCIWAVHFLLGIVAPCNASFTSQELTSHLAKTKAALIIAHSDVLPAVVGAAQKLSFPLDRIICIDDNVSYTSVPTLISQSALSPLNVPEQRLRPGESKKQIAFLNSSSGTTGPPKLVAISHFAVIANVLQAAALNRIQDESIPWDDRRYRPGDSCLAVLPMSHIYGLVVILHFNLFAGLSVVVVPKFSFPDMLKSIVRHKISHLMVVPPQVVLLCKDPSVKRSDLQSVRVVLCAASTLPLELYNQLAQLLPNAHIGQAYGSTEGTGIVSMCPITDKRNPHGGVFVPGVFGRVVKADGSLGKVDEEGELHIKTAAASSGYYGDEQATKETFLEGGWIRSGDVVRIDAKGNIVVVDRSKEILKVRGFQVAPAELEGTLLDHPYVADVCVVPLPDTYSGELPLAFVVPSQEAKGAIKRTGTDNTVKVAIMKHVADNKAPFKHLAVVEFLDAVPKTPSGKLLRRDLKEKAKVLKSTKEKGKL